jgi:hypothetical protein
VGFGADEHLTVAAVNQRVGAALAVQHLVNLGHTVDRPRFGAAGLD